MADTNEKYCRIKVQTLAELVRASETLDALVGGGVDSWMWYDESITSFYESLNLDMDDIAVESDEEVIERYLGLSG